MTSESTKKPQWFDEEGYEPTELERLRDTLKDCQRWHAVREAIERCAGESWKASEHRFRARVLWFVLEKGDNFRQALERWSAEQESKASDG